MKQKVFLFGLIIIITIFLTGFSAYADPVDFQTARKAAHQKLFELSKAGILSIKNDKNIYYNKEGKALFYIFELNPSGYIVVTGQVLCNMLLPAIKEIRNLQLWNYFQEVSKHHKLYRLFPYNADKLRKNLLEKMNPNINQFPGTVLFHRYFGNQSNPIVHLCSMLNKEAQ